MWHPHKKWLLPSGDTYEVLRNNRLFRGVRRRMDGVPSTIVCITNNWLTILEYFKTAKQIDNESPYGKVMIAKYFRAATRVQSIWRGYLQRAVRGGKKRKKGKNEKGKGKKK